jgi:hypothetical protein
MSIQVGDLVRFKSNLYSDEDGAIYFVLEINGDRTLLELANTNMVIRPQSVAMVSDLEKIDLEAGC